MRGYMFRSRWSALLFVGLVLLGVANLVGTEEEGGAIDAARAQFSDQHDQAEAFTQYSPAGQNADEVALQFAQDEELIDPATGYDPTPVDDFAASQEISREVVPGAQVVIVAPDGGRQTGQ